MEAIRRIKEELPGVYTTLGVSNVSFGLKPAARHVLNSVFIAECVAAVRGTHTDDRSTNYATLE